jgi:hypothetical protein
MKIFAPSLQKKIKNGFPREFPDEIAGILINAGYTHEQALLAAKTESGKRKLQIDTCLPLSIILSMKSYGFPKA